jgi:hypothetical protein
MKKGAGLNHFYRRKEITPSLGPDPDGGKVDKDKGQGIKILDALKNAPDSRQVDLPEEKKEKNQAEEKSDPVTVSAHAISRIRRQM